MQTLCCHTLFVCLFLMELCLLIPDSVWLYPLMSQDWKNVKWILVLCAPSSSIFCAPLVSSSSLLLSVLHLSVLHLCILVSVLLLYSSFLFFIDPPTQIAVLLIVSCGLTSFRCRETVGVNGGWGSQKLLKYCYLVNASTHVEVNVVIKIIPWVRVQNYLLKKYIYLSNK